MQSQAHFGAWLYPRWVLINSVVAAAAIGIPALVAWAFLAGIKGTPPYAAIVGVSVVVAISGAMLAALFLGYPQWWLIRWRLPGLSLARWNTAVAIGHALCWIGAAAFVAHSQVSPGAGWRITSGTAPPQAWILVGGFAIGLVIAVPQWLVLRRYVDRAWWWLYANGLAWTVAVSTLAIALRGAPIKGGRMIVAAIGGGSLAVGLIVTAINGIFLVFLLRTVRNSGLPTSDFDLYPTKKQTAKIGMPPLDRRKSERQQTATRYASRGAA